MKFLLRKYGVEFTEFEGINRGWAEGSQIQ